MAAPLCAAAVRQGPRWGRTRPTSSRRVHEGRSERPESEPFHAGPVATGLASIGRGGNLGPAPVHRDADPRRGGRRPRNAGPSFLGRTGSAPRGADVGGRTERRDRARPSVVRPGARASEARRRGPGAAGGRERDGREGPLDPPSAPRSRRAAGGPQRAGPARVGPAGSIVRCGPRLARRSPSCPPGRGREGAHRRVGCERPRRAPRRRRVSR